MSATAVVRSALKTVTTAGTRVQLSTSVIYAYGLKVKALAANTGIMYVGDVTVSATAGYPLPAGEEYAPLRDMPESLKGLPVDLSQVYVDASVSGEKVAFTYFEVSGS